MPYEISGSYAFCQPTKSVAPKVYDFSGVMRYGGYALGGSQLYMYRETTMSYVVISNESRGLQTLSKAYMWQVQHMYPCVSI